MGNLSRRVYPGFSKLNNRRIDLVEKKHKGGGLTEQEKRELDMLQTVVGAMVEYRYPTPVLNATVLELMRKVGLDEKA